MILYVKNNAGVLFLVNVSEPVTGVQIDGLRIVFAEPGAFLPVHGGYVVAGRSEIVAGTLVQPAMFGDTTVPAGTEIYFENISVLVETLGGVQLTVPVIRCAGMSLITEGLALTDMELRVTHTVISDCISSRPVLVPDIVDTVGVGA
jgi:hypothetical protein